MSYFIDRRPNGRNKSAVNRQRFLRRYRDHIRKSVDQAVRKRSITDMERGEEVSIPTRDIHEPTFHHSQSGRREGVLPGNREFHQGDRIARPQGGGSGSGGGQGQASPDGEGMDEFVFSLTRDEFMEFLFEGLELPNLVKNELGSAEETRPVHGGIVREGTPSRLHVVRSMRSAYARRLAMGAGIRRELKACEAEREALLAQSVGLHDLQGQDSQQLNALEASIAQLRERLKKVPFLDTEDLRYRHLKHEPVPSTKAVMVCMMDVSGSMTEQHKDIAKRFFLLLYLFLERNYDKVDLVFIRHHTSAREVDEEEFFYSRETGGTIVSSALKMASSIIEARYPPAQWNIYLAQASDGDNWDDDSDVCAQWLTQQLLPKARYYAYVEITPHAHQALWDAYETVQSRFPERFAMRQIVDAGDIFPVFRDLFKKATA